MTTRSDLDRSLGAWFRASAAEAMPDYLDEIVDRVARERQRAWWSSLERWLPVDLTTRATTLAPPRNVRLVLAAGLIVLIVATAILAVGSTRTRPAPPFGEARNGAIVFATSGDIYQVASIDSPPRLIVGGPAVDSSPLFWRDGTRLGFLRESDEAGQEFALMVADSDGSDVRELVGVSEPPWCADVAPDGSVIAVCAELGSGRGVYLLKADGSEAPRHLDIGIHDVAWLGWRPPDGRELVYFDNHSGKLTLYGVRSDGTGRNLIKHIGVVDSATMGQLDPSLSSDGRFMVYASVDDGVFRNHLLDLDTGVDGALSLGPVGGHELHGVLSPDGTKLLFHYADGHTDFIQEMLAPLDGSAPAIAIGPPYPIINGSADLNQSFSPDGGSIVVYAGHEKVARIIDATTGGRGRPSTWETGDLPAWQRQAP